MCGPKKMKITEAELEEALDSRSDKPIYRILKKARVGIAGLGGSLGGGIPLWRKGRRELDWMMDDYVRRYAPKPYSSNISVGPTNNGLGLALNF